LYKYSKGEKDLYKINETIYIYLQYDSTPFQYNFLWYESENKDKTKGNHKRKKMNDLFPVEGESMSIQDLSVK
jgi:hypothetical protein